MKMKIRRIVSFDEESASTTYSARSEQDKGKGKAPRVLSDSRKSDTHDPAEKPSKKNTR